MVVLDAAFANAGQKPGLEIWRIEQMQVKPVEQRLYGTFFSGDSYIVLQTKQLNSGRFEWNIHFWLGRDTTQDEYATAAIKSVELDETLGGSPIQHREVQDHESDEFLSLFKDGVKYLEGGVDSGFNEVDRTIHKRLLQVKGKRNVRVREVPLDAASMNKGDCFILDCRDNLYVWTGPESGRLERVKAIQVANNIRDQVHGGRSKIHIIDDSSQKDEVTTFFEELEKGTEADVKPAEEGGDDAQHERTGNEDVSLHRVSDADGELKIVQVAEKPLSQESLDENDCFVLDGGNTIFVWVGKGATQRERKGSIQFAQKYIEQKGLPNWTKVSRVIGGAEPPLFKQYFAHWVEPVPTFSGRIDAMSRIEAVDKGFNVATMHADKRRLYEKSLGRACGFMPDDASGQIEIWRVENFELVEVDKSVYGFLFGGDSYVMKYSCTNGRDYVIYFWQGKDSSQDEKAASALWAVKKANECCGRAVQVRIVQGNEPEHFLRIFKGRMIVFSGGRASGFRNIQDRDSYDLDGTRLFHVRGTSDVDVRAVQVEEEPASLNSEDVFVLETPKDFFVWYGNYAIEEEKAMGKKMCELIRPGCKPTELNEGSETDAFWAALGGKGPYKKAHKTPVNPLLAPRLFKCSTATGKLRVEQIHDFTQADLAVDDVMIMDSGEEIYIWIGDGSTEEERSKSLEIAEEYVKTDPTERNIDNTLIVKVNQGQESESFTSLFENWNPDFWKVMKSYEQLRDEIRSALKR